MVRKSIVIRAALGAAFVFGLAYTQMLDSMRPAYAARLEIIIVDGHSGHTVPGRVYLWKNGRPFRLSPVDCLLPLRGEGGEPGTDAFHRERLWKQSRLAKSLEVTSAGESHFILLDGRAVFDLPAGQYRLEAYRGLFSSPGAAELILKPRETKQVQLTVAPMAPGRQDRWLSG